MFASNDNNTSCVLAKNLGGRVVSNNLLPSFSSLLELRLQYVARLGVSFYEEVGFFSSLKVNDSFNAIISDADAICI